MIKKEKKHKTPVMLILIAISIPLCAIIYFISINIPNNNWTTKIKYISIQSNSTATDLICEIDLNTEYNSTIEIKDYDFSVLIKGNPITAYGIKKEANVNTSSSDNTFNNYAKIESQITITIRFKYNINELDTPLSFMYKGKKLQLGKTIKF